MVFRLHGVLADRCFVLQIEIPFFQFLNHQIAGGGFKFTDLAVPPLASPVGAGDHFRFRQQKPLRFRAGRVEQKVAKGTKKEIPDLCYLRFLL